MKVDHVYDHSGFRRKPADNGNAFLGEMPKREDSQIELSLADQLVRMPAETHDDFDSALLKHSHAPPAPTFIMRDKRDRPTGLLQKPDQMKNAPRAAFTIELGDARGTHEGSLSSH